MKGRKRQILEQIFAGWPRETGRRTRVPLSRRWPAPSASPRSPRYRWKQTGLPPSRMTPARGERDDPDTSTTPGEEPTGKRGR